MRLYLDIGNTRCKWVLEDDNADVAFKKIGSVVYKKDGWSQLDQLSGVASTLTAIWASCVASDEVRLLIDSWAEREFNLTVNWLKVVSQQCGVDNTYEDLSQLGIDRWAAVLGAKQYLLENDYEGSVAIVVDAGTAVTVDVLSHNLNFQGGAILPGLKMMHDALVGRTEGIVSSLVTEMPLPGKNTLQCVNSGVHYGLFGAIERIVAEIQFTLNVSSSKLVLLLTGGDAELIQQNSRLEFVVLPGLVIDGLKCVANAGDF